MIDHRTLMRMTNLIAGITALVIAIGVPAGFLYVRYEQAGLAAQSEVELTAQRVGRLVNLSPDYWHYESDRIGQILAYLHGGERGHYHRVTDLDGKTIAEFPSPRPDMKDMFLTRSQVLTDYGEPVGYVETTMATANIISYTMFLALISCAAGVAIFMLLRVYPLRALNHAWDRVTYLANYDSLTGLPNRNQFMEQLRMGLANAARYRHKVSVFAIDIDCFKDVNDTLGHAVGDRVLQQAALRLKSLVREGDVLARLGGDEFVLMQIEGPEIELAPVTAERLIEGIGRPFYIEGHEVQVAASVGIATFEPADPVDGGQLLKNADLALYRSKACGTGTFHFFQAEMDAELHERKMLEAELRTALRERQFVMYYQPQLDLKTQQVTGMEALIRWRHPTRGIVGPDQFIPAAEDMGLILPLSEWVLETACSDAVAWDPLRVAVNMSASQFQESDLVDVIKGVLARTGLPPSRLEIEITEEILMTDTERSVRVLEELRGLGIHVAMDDFGTGYSSLGYLRRFPFDKIKIDKSFVADLGQGEDPLAIVTAIIQLGRALGIQVNAEGVETLEQAELLLREGCDEVQGFLFGKPLPRDVTNELVARVRTGADLPEAGHKLPSVASASGWAS